MTHPLGTALSIAAAAIPTTMTYDGMPPARFQASAEMHVKYVPDPNTEGACGISSTGRFAACVRGPMNNRIVYLPNPCALGDIEQFARLTCHEMAHVNGWPINHGA